MSNNKGVIRRCVKLIEQSRYCFISNLSGYHVCILSSNLFLEPYCHQVSMNFRCIISYTIKDLPVFFFLGGGLGAD